MSATKMTCDDASEPTQASETIEDNEIRVTAQGRMRNYIAYATSLFKEKQLKTVVLKGMGRVINKTVSLAEILKRQVKGLYHYAEIGSVRVVEENNGENVKETSRLLSVIKITLTKETVDVHGCYQPPVEECLSEMTVKTTAAKRQTPRVGQKLKTKVQNSTSDATKVTGTDGNEGKDLTNEGKDPTNEGKDPTNEGKDPTNEVKEKEQEN